MITKPENPSMLANLPEGETLENIVTYQTYIDTAHPRQQLEDGTMISKTKKEIAQIKTVLNEMKLEIRKHKGIEK